MPKYLHSISDADAVAMASVRAMLRALPPLQITPEARPMFDQMIEQTPAAESVSYEASSVGGICGWWCRPPDAASHAAILYLHGGGYVIGSAAAYRRPVSQIAASCGVSAFVADYRLAPEHRFPAAIDDAVAAYQGLVDLGFSHIVVAGDSAGGGLTLAVCSILAVRGRDLPAAAIAISPLTDLTASGRSYSTRADADPLLSRDAVIAISETYLAGAEPTDPRASPLFGPVSHLPPMQIHVGEDEVLLDDAMRYADLAVHAGGRIDLHVWQGMLHVFTSSIALLEAAREAVRQIGAFIGAHVASDTAILRAPGAGSGP
jgi:monoterpene epsilon-lactone hydrolase